MLVWLAYKFAEGNRGTSGDDPSWITNTFAVLVVYVVCVLAMTGAARLVLTAAYDVAAGRTARLLLVALPIGGTIATLCAVAVAAAQAYSERPGTLASIGATVLVIVVLTMTVARWFAVRTVSPSGHSVDLVLDPGL